MFNRNFKKISLDNIGLTMCGEGYLSDYVNEATRNDLRIEFLGRGDKADKEAVFLKSDVMIVVSI